MLTKSAQGILAMAGASFIWGSAAIYFKAVGDVQPLEMLAHRTVWSAMFMALILGVQGRLGAVRALLSDRNERLRALGAAGFLTINFLVFIWAVQVGRAVESGLGYYIFPLFAVALGALVQGERHSTTKWVAVALAVLAVGVLTWGLGVAPWVSLLLAASFSVYGLIKSRMRAGAVVSVAAEVWLLTPIALVFLAGAHLAGWSVSFGPGAGMRVGVFGTTLVDSLLLIVAGPLTAMPILLFSYATQRSSYAALGLVQYINPTLQVLVATLLFGEVFTGWHAAALALIWLALALYSAESFRQGRAARRAVSKAVPQGLTGT
jgi:chloramphenicol-sensitive protein RarD